MKSFLKVSMSSALLIGGLVFASPVNADEKQQQSNDVSINQTTESTLQLNLDDNMTFEENEYFEAFLVDNKTGETEALPMETKDQNGNPVSLVYIENDKGLEVQVLAQGAQLRGLGQCIAGAAGGAVTGGTTGGLGGAAVGTVTLPGIGTVSAGLVGAIGGTIGGGLTGAATFC